MVHLPAVNKNKRILYGVIASCICLAIVTSTLFLWSQRDSQAPHPTTGIQGKSKPADARADTVSNSPTFTFAAAGDFNTTSEFTKGLAQIKAARADFTLALGDFGYGSVSERDWCNKITAALGATHPFELIAGNHDDTGDNDMGRYAECLPNRIPQMIGEYGRQYYFDYHNLARVIAISPDIEIRGETYQYRPGTAQHQWLTDRIDEAHAKKLPWVIVAMHKNCLTSGVKTCEIGEDVFNLLVQKRVDLILQGHEHAYFRSKQLTTNASCPAIPMSFNEACLTDPAAESRAQSHPTTDTYPKGEGSVLVINGTGGTTLRDAQLNGPSSPYFASIHAKNAQPAHGPSLFVVGKDKLEARFVDTEGKTQDKFVISR